MNIQETEGINEMEFSRLDQQFSYLFQHAVKHGLSSLIVVSDNDVRMQVIEFFKRRADFVYYGNDPVSADLPGIYITSEPSPSLVNRFKSIGIARFDSDTDFDGLIQESISNQIPVLVTEKNSEIGGYWSPGVFERDVPDYPKVFKHLENEDIRDQFIDTFSIAESEIDIICPWINQNVVNDKLISLMAEALGRGVKIRIIYGIGEDVDKRSQTSEETVNMLRERFDHYQGRLIIKRDNTHVKLLICDNKYMMMGSYNFLSFAGDYDGNDLRGEAVNFEVDSTKISQLRIHHFS